MPTAPRPGFALCRLRPPFVVRLLAVATLLACGTEEADGGEGGAGDLGAELVVDDRCEGAPTYTACGGPLDGVWTVDHACGDHRIEIDLLYGGPLSFDCWIPARIEHEVRGSVTYADGLETADLSLRSRSRFTIPDVCAAALEPALAPAAFCARFEATVPAEGRVGGCVHGDGGCACDFRTAGTLRHARAYAPGFGGLTVEFPRDDDAGFSFCVDGDTLVQARGDMFLHLVR